MARYIGYRSKMSRREGIDLFLMSNKRNIRSKCKLNSKPGQNVNSFNNKFSDYNNQLREKQKIKRIYGILEKQFKIYFIKSKKKKGNTGEILLNFLETRLDNIIYRMGFGSTRAESRQMLLHKFFTLNRKIINIPSYQVKIGDIIEVRDKFKKNNKIINSIFSLKKKNIYSNWIYIDFKKFTGILKNLPNKKYLLNNINESLVIEFYSR